MTYTKRMSQPTAPQFSPQLEPGAVQLFSPEATLENLIFEDIILANRKLPNISLEEVRLTRAVCTGAMLAKIAARDILIERCDFSAAHCTDGSFQRAVFKATRLTGWDISNGVLKDVVLEGCKLDLTNFRFAALTRVTFIDCQLQNADFISAELTHVSFQNCVLEDTIFAQCTMKDVDFRTSQLTLTGWQSLKGATIDSAQLMAAAPYLAHELGIKIEEM